MVYQVPCFFGSPVQYFRWIFLIGEHCFKAFCVAIEVIQVKANYSESVGLREWNAGLAMFRVGTIKVKILLTVYGLPVELR